jgi:CDP-4-dehydro-6-deoxyglucose reductase
MSTPAALNNTLFESTLVGNHLPGKVTRLSWLKTDLIQVHLAMPVDFPYFHPGQYIELALADGTSRPFSIANYHPQAEEIELHIEARAESQATWRMVKQMQQFGEIGVYPAKGSVRLRPSIGAQVFLAAGTGFAQIKALMEQYLFHRQPNSNVDEFPTYLVWGSENPEQRYLEELIESWCQQHPSLRYLPLNWQAGDCWGEVVTAEVEHLSQCQIYACGSPGRIYKTLEHLEKQGMKTTQIQSDVFSYAPRPPEQVPGNAM